ncbi:MAG: hypothetical protein WBD53_22455 [Xanthobacteraceae bacterium]
MRPTSLQSDRLQPGHIARRPKESPSDRIAAALTGPEATALAIFCALGLLLTAAFYLLVPNFAEIVASLQPYF